MKFIFRTALFALFLLLGAGTATASADPGEWRITATPAGHEVTWISPGPLPVTSARPVVLLDGRPLGPATVSPDGRKVSAAIPGDKAPSPDRLEVTLSGRALSEPAPEPEVTPSPAWIAPAGVLPDLGYDPGVKGPHAIRTDNYTAPPWKYPGMRRKLEMKGHVVTPSDPTVAATAPLVLFLHGRHSSCYRTGKRRADEGGWPCTGRARPVPSLLGYDYLQRILASQGFATVSIAANAINAQDGAKPDGGASARSALVRRHLDLWAGWVASGKRKADLGRVILVGHSRGGEGVNRAAEEIPLSAPYRVAGQVLLAPTNFARQSAAFIPTVTVLPYCDGDVSDLQGEAYTDNSIGLAAGDDSLKSSVTMFGANHNYFNTEWTPGLSKAPSVDDSVAPPRSLCGKRGATRLTAAEQRRSARSLVGGAVQLMTGTDARPVTLFDGSPVRVGPVRRAPVISQSVGGGKLTLVPGRDFTPVGGSAGTRICNGYVSPDRGRACARLDDADLTPHWVGTFPRGKPTRPALAMSWNRPGRTAPLDLDRDLDLTGRDRLDLRVVVVPSDRSVRLGVTLVDAGGTRAVLQPRGNGRVNAMPADRGRNPFTRGRWLARTLTVPVPDDASVPADLTRIREIELTGEAKPDCGADCPGSSRIRVLDISARTGGALPAPPVERLPQIRLRNLSIPEGGPGRRQARLRFRIRGGITDPDTRFRVLSAGETGLAQESPPITVSLTPGQKSGTILIPYRGNNGYNPARRIQVGAFPIRGAIPTANTAVVTLTSDDRKPRLRIRAAGKSIRAGRAARWRVSLDGPVSQPTILDARFVRVPGSPPLRLGDLPAHWAGRHLLGAEGRGPGTPVTHRKIWMDLGLLHWQHPVAITVPTRPGVEPPTRGVRLMVRATGFGRLFSPVVRVRPR